MGGWAWGLEGEGDGEGEMERAGRARWLLFFKKIKILIKILSRVVTSRLGKGLSFPEAK